MVTAADMAVGMAEMGKGKKTMDTATPMGKNKVTKVPAMAMGKNMGVTVTAVAMGKNMGAMDTVIKRRLPVNPTASKAFTRL